MTMPCPVAKYLETYATDRRPLVAGELTGIDQVVAMPVLAEREHLFTTLADLARNREAEVRRTLVICVVNNRGPRLAAAEIRENNRQTLLGLDALVQGGPPPPEFLAAPALTACFAAVRRGGLRVAYLDASSPGKEMPDKGGGVGMARKIGMDAALRVFDYASPAGKIIFCLDADTRVERDYLSVVRGACEGGGMQAAVVGFSHPSPAGLLPRIAIRTYEIFLNYYVLGLRYAGSPYAFHTVGSTMVCTADAYAAVRGMNTREAAEDFYFLTKLAKVYPVGRIGATQVHPSARSSARVPFGTGRQMIRFLAEGTREYLLYDPRVFGILRQWLSTVHGHPDREGRVLQAAAEEIDPGLGAFLRTKRFAETWDRIRGNCRDGGGLVRQFAFWFDGFKTLKLIRFLTEEGYPRVPMFAAVEGLMGLMQREARSRIGAEQVVKK